MATESRAWGAANSTSFQRQDGLQWPLSGLKQTPFTTLGSQQADVCGVDRTLRFPSLVHTVSLTYTQSKIQSWLQRTKKNQYSNNMEVYLRYLHFQKFGIISIFLCFWKKSLMLTKAAFIWSKICNIAKDYNIVVNLILIQTIFYLSIFRKT